MTPLDFTIRTLDASDDLEELLALVRTAFAELAIDPPSSMTRETIDSIRRRAATQTVFVAFAGGRLVGSVFCEQRAPALYLGRLAVEKTWRRRGVASALLAAAKAHAQSLELEALTLSTRIALAGNVAYFRRQGFEVIAQTSHPGYTEPTSYDMRLSLRA